MQLPVVVLCMIYRHSLRIAWAHADSTGQAMAMRRYCCQYASSSLAGVLPLLHLSNLWPQACLIFNAVLLDVAFCITQGRSGDQWHARYEQHASMPIWQHRACVIHIQCFSLTCTVEYGLATRPVPAALPEAPGCNVSQQPHLSLRPKVHIYASACLTRTEYPFAPLPRARALRESSAISKECLTA